MVDRRGRIPDKTSVDPFDLLTVRKHAYKLLVLIYRLTDNYDDYKKRLNNDEFLEVYVLACSFETAIHDLLDRIRINSNVYDQVGRNRNDYN